MATIVNNPNSDSSSSTGIIVGVIIALIIIALFFLYGLPYLRGGATSSSQTPGASLNVNLPSGGSTGGTGGATSGQ